MFAKRIRKNIIYYKNQYSGIINVIILLLMMHHYIIIIIIIQVSQWRIYWEGSFSIVVLGPKHHIAYFMQTEYDERSSHGCRRVADIPLKLAKIISSTKLRVRPQWRMTVVV